MSDFDKCVEACRVLLIKIDYHNEWAEIEDQLREAVEKITEEIYYTKPMREALRMLGVDT